MNEAVEARRDTRDTAARIYPARGGDRQTAILPLILNQLEPSSAAQPSRRKCIERVVHSKLLAQRAQLVRELNGEA